ncbi:hypothetical protein Pmani_013029 [Petrolisthes manimaculis]|uniref:Uncharacterized protein n=1 Tax=Petrolisthes manimaculis TaxID=1843537 RepID=A0AAE1PW27_9EUCA|nr:hypothetical protein Pmani_013029 [Petrolisthes manimaculis]
MRVSARKGKESAMSERECQKRERWEWRWEYQCSRHPCWRNVYCIGPTHTRQESQSRTVKIMRCLLLLSILAWVSVIGQAQPPQEQQVRDDDVGEGVVNDEEEEEGEEGLVVDPEWYVQGCRYYCIYGDLPYCCDDGSLPLPENHNLHEDLTCPAMEDQICKTSGIYFLNRAARPDVRLLLKGTPKKQTPCASDGYCKWDMKCCPTPCGSRHICMPDPASVLLQGDNNDEGDEEEEVVVVEKHSEGNQHHHESTPPPPPPLPSTSKQQQQQQQQKTTHDPQHSGTGGDDGDTTTTKTTTTTTKTEGRDSSNKRQQQLQQHHHNSKSLSLKLGPFIHSGHTKLRRSSSLRLLTQNNERDPIDDETGVGTNKQPAGSTVGVGGGGGGKHRALRRTVSASGHHSSKPVQKILRQPRRRHNTVRGVSGLSVRAHNTFYTYHSNLI